MRRMCSICLVLALALVVPSMAFGLTPLEQLGKNIYFDKISEPENMSCATCHAPRTGFTTPVGGINRKGAVMPGAVPKRFGNRRPPSAAYATLSPIFHFDDDEGLFLGGNFWDGRATGETLGNPAAEQALGPFLNPVEHNNPSKAAVLEKIAASKYASLWTDVWGTPISTEPAHIDENYDRIGLAIAAFEGSSEVNQFSSKFDLFWANAEAAALDVTVINMSNWGTYEGLGLTTTEVRGLALFNDESRGMCALCHVLDPVEMGGQLMPPVFTDFSFDNLGVPRNEKNPFYDMDTVYLDDGSPINPEGAAWVDPGLGGFLSGHSNPAWQGMAEENMGKHKVPTLRNVTQSEDPDFPKAYMHNGVFKSLDEVVHFYNTRDVESWPPAEVAANVNTDELGDLGLTALEEADIVAFMNTLNDGYVPDGGIMLARPEIRPQISPNPFRGGTTVSYVLPDTGPVKVEVFDVAGRRVATLVDGFREPGRHSETLWLPARTSGVYFVRVQTAWGTTSTKAIALE